MKRCVFCSAAAVFGLALGAAVAAPSSNVAWTPETMALIKGGDVGKGRELAASCGGCHGTEGVSPVPTYPHLAGQAPDYTFKQLRDYKDGTRAHALMGGLVAGLDDQAMADLSAFYASQPVPAGQASDGDLDAARELVRKGDGKRLIPSCASCHNEPRRRRHHGAPLLEGQTAAYFKQTMQAYRTGARGNDVYAVMRSIAEQLTVDEIDALAAYYAAAGSQ